VNKVTYTWDQNVSVVIIFQSMMVFPTTATVCEKACKDLPSDPVSTSSIKTEYILNYCVTNNTYLL